MVAARIIVNPDWFFFFGMKRKLLFFGLFVARKKSIFQRIVKKLVIILPKDLTLPMYMYYILHILCTNYLYQISTLYTQIVDILGGSWVKGLVRVKTTSNRKKIM